MKGKNTKAERRKADVNLTARRLGLLALLLLALALPALYIGVARSRAQVRPTSVKAGPQTPPQTRGPEALSLGRLQPVSVVQVNFKDLARKDASRRPAARS